MNRLSWIKNYTWLIVGCALLLFAGAKWNVPLATWLAPIFLPLALLVISDLLPSGADRPGAKRP